ncbi:hypothetical protein ABE438_14765 [Bosea sp. TWI1241]|uniref:hypothetical protein n=1 Tax=Bosea sp. TWI1241 TaxID=3148904 RepID=UPI003209B570
MQRNINVLPVDKLGVVQEHEGALLVSFFAPDGGEFGFLLPEGIAAELSGALLQRPHSDPHSTPAPQLSEGDVDCHVSNVEALAPEGDKLVLRLVSDAGPALTFRLGARMAMRWRDMLTDQIERHQRKNRQ